MEISAVKTPIDFGGFANLAQTNPVIQPVVNVPTANTGNFADESVTAQTDEKIHKEPADLQEVTQITEAMNKFIQAMNANIRFLIHQETNQIMVQVIDQTDNKVLKEFPPHEFLDTMAAIRDYVGIIMDKKI